MTVETSIDMYHTRDDDPYAEMRERHPHLFEPIPLAIGQSEENPEGYANGSVAGWRNIESPDFIEVSDNGEPLVNVDHLNPPIFTTGDYFAKLGNSGYEKPLDGAPLAQYIRVGVGEKLTRVQALLPDNCRLVVFDAWRSLATQQATYEMCYESLVDKLIEEGVLLPDEELTPEAATIISTETQKFISLPSPFPEGAEQSAEDKARAMRIPSPHNTGGSIDLAFVIIEGEEHLAHLRELETIASSEEDPFSVRKAEANFLIAMIYRNHARLPDFGTAFDFAGAQSALAYCETNDLGAEARDSRRILYNAMTGAGFEPYEEEWWHFNDGNQMAETTKRRRTGEEGVAKYGNAELSEAQKYHEYIHQQLFALLAEVSSNPVAAQNIPEDLKKHGATPELVLDLSAHIGDPKETASFIPTHDMKYRGELSSELKQAVTAAQRR